LPIAIKFDDDLCVYAGGGLVARDRGSTDALILLMEQNSNSRVLAFRFNKATRLYRAFVVNDENPAYLGADAANHIQNKLAYPVARYDDGNGWGNGSFCVAHL
jgi:hypothetical protein